MQALGAEVSNFDTWNAIAGGYGALGLGAIVAGSGLGLFIYRVRAKAKAEASLVTSRYRFLAGMGLPSQFQITIHNATPHPLNYVQVNYWDGASWQLTLAPSTTTNDPVVSPGDEGSVLVPAVTNDLDEFDNYYYLTYEDSRRRTWHRLVDSPTLLGRAEVRRLRNLHGTI